MTKRVKVEVMHNGCIAVNDTRITNRSTKWGILKVIDKFYVNPENVLKHLKKRGHEKLIPLIDDGEWVRDE